MMGAKSALETEIIQCILHSSAIIFHTQIRIVFVPLCSGIRIIITGQHKELLLTNRIRREKTLISFAIDVAFCDALIVEDLFTSKVKILTVVIKSKVNQSGRVNCFGEHRHTQARTTGDVLTFCRRHQGEPRNRTAGIEGCNHTLRQRSLFICSILRIAVFTGEVFVGDGVTILAALVGLQIYTGITVYIDLTG